MHLLNPDTLVEVSPCMTAIFSVISDTPEVNEGLTEESGSFFSRLCMTESSNFESVASSFVILLVSTYDRFL